jgi:peptide/nickel transport system permease protein
MKLLYYIVRRLLLLIPFLIGLTLLIFLLSRVVPADPVGLAIGKNATEAMRQQVAKQFGLDKPVYEQYLLFLRDLLKGDFGKSIATRAPVINDLRRYLPATIELTFAALFLAMLIGIPLGVLSAWFRDRSVDHSARLFSLFGVSFPNFWLGLMLQLIVVALAINLPISGRFSDTVAPPKTITGLLTVDSILAFDFKSLGISMEYLLLPALTLALASLAEISRLTRSGIIEAMGKDYVTTAKANGLPDLIILFRYALRNAAIPILTIGGLLFTWTLAGSVLVETIFGWPGLGRYAVKSSLFMDYRPILAVVLVFGLSAAIINLIIDILYRVIDPRITYQ